MRALFIHNIGGFMAAGLLHRPRCLFPAISYVNNRSLKTHARCVVSGDHRYQTTTTEDDGGKPHQTLLVGSQQDAASRGIMNALLAREDWLDKSVGTEVGDMAGGKAWTHARAPVSMWSVAGRLLDLDHVDRRWAQLREEKDGEVVLKQQQRRLHPLSDVVFLSRHVAKSGVPSLCVHPIGVPDVSGIDYSTSALAVRIQL